MSSINLIALRTHLKMVGTGPDYRLTPKLSCLDLKYPRPSADTFGELSS